MVNYLEFVYFNNNIFRILDFSNQNQLLTILNVQNNPFLTYINIQNGLNFDIGFDFSNLPSLVYVCVDDVTNTNFTDAILSQVGHVVLFTENCLSVEPLYIPDSLFNQALFEFGVINVNNDGIIQKIEANNFSGDFSQLNSTYVYNDLRGLEEFHNITTIEIDNSTVTELPLSPIANYEIITFTNSLVTELDFSNVNNSTIYNLSNNSNLTYINLKNGFNDVIGGINVQNTPNLQTVCIDDLNNETLKNNIIASTGHAVNFIDCAAANLQDENSLVLKIFPNPVNDILTIETTNEINKIVVYNTLGKVILTSLKDKIDVSSLTNGLYYVKIITNTGNIGTSKFIKK